MQNCKEIYWLEDYNEIQCALRIGALFFIQSVSCHSYTNGIGVSLVTHKNSIKFIYFDTPSSLISRKLYEMLIILDIKCDIFDTLFRCIQLLQNDTLYQRVHARTILILESFPCEKFRPPRGFEPRIRYGRGRGFESPWRPRFFTWKAF